MIYEARLEELRIPFSGRSLTTIESILGKPSHAAASRRATFWQNPTLRYGRSHAVQLLAAFNLSLLWSIAERVRRLLRNWNKRKPIECRTQMPLDVVRARFSWFVATNNISAAVLTFLDFRCWVRAEELVCCRWMTLMRAPDIIKDRYPQNLQPLVYSKAEADESRQEQHPVRRRQKRAPRPAPCLAGARPSCAGSALPHVPLTTTGFWKYWEAGLKELKLEHSGLVPSGLRPSGATYHYLMNQDVPRL